MRQDANKIDHLELPQSCVEMLSCIHTLDLEDGQRKALAIAMDKILDDTTRRRRILSLVQDALGQLRLDMKYLMFDLDATRKERDAAMEKK
jgi:hypothetical protein